MGLFSKNVLDTTSDLARNGSYGGQYMVGELVTIGLRALLVYSLTNQFSI
jgi:hypothetical protein